MELENSQNNALAKLPILKLGEYEMWEIRIKQYFQIQDYALWEMTVPSTTEEKNCKKMISKARSLLLHGTPKNYQLLPKQNNASRGFKCLKFLEAYLLKGIHKWCILDDKPDFETMGLDDLYNNFKIVEQKVKRTVAANNDDKNLAFLTTSSPSSTNTINTVNTGVSTGNTKRARSSIRELKEDIIEGSSTRINSSKHGFKAFTDTEVKVYLIGISLRTELEKVKEEKEAFEFKLAKFEKSSKDLDDLLYASPESNNSKENTDDSLTQQPKTVTETSSVVSPLKVDKAWKEKFFHPANHVRVEEPKKARENIGAPIIEDWCSRHMTGNIAHLSDFKDFDGGYVTFVGGAYGGRITGKREKGIKREYSVARTPQKNGVAERKNRTLIEATRTMLADSKLPTTFWTEAVSTACYVQNRVLIVKPHNKTPYELFKGFKPAIGFMKPFGCHVTILNTLDNLSKFDGKSDEGFFVGYSLSSKAFRVYNTRTRKVQENLHIGFLENKPMIEGNGPKWLFDIDSLTQSMNYVPVVAGTFSNDFAGIQGVSESSTSSQQDQDNQDCIVMPIWKDASYFGDAAPRSVADAQIQDKD
ncbi:putative ribonuclease H-like domain-containing protein, partial [Tanacetum coccineum]